MHRASTPQIAHSGNEGGGGDLGGGGDEGGDRGGDGGGRDGSGGGGDGGGEAIGDGEGGDGGDRGGDDGRGGDDSDTEARGRGSALHVHVHAHVRGPARQAAVFAQRVRHGADVPDVSELLSLLYAAKLWSKMSHADFVARIRPVCSSPSGHCLAGGGTNDKRLAAPSLSDGVGQSIDDKSVAAPSSSDGVGQGGGCDWLTIALCVVGGHGGEGGDGDRGGDDS